MLAKDWKFDHLADKYLLAVLSDVELNLINTKVYIPVAAIFAKVAFSCRYFVRYLITHLLRRQKINHLLFMNNPLQANYSS